jgi:NADP-dependent 3-hydroxy acid dehydrogenase YdfG
LATEFRARLILVGRRPLTEPIWLQLEALEAAGGAALYARADVSDPGAFARAVDIGREHFGRIDGAIHSAGTLEDGLLANMDERSLRAVLAPKTVGMVAFGEALRDEPLDFVLLYSSIQSTLGNAGQGNYAAASSFQDAYGAALRDRLRCPVRVLNWGYWGSVGIVAGPDYRRRMAAVGVESIEPNEGIEVVRIALASQAPEQLIAVKADARFLERARLRLQADDGGGPDRIPSVLKRSLALLAQQEGL